MACRSLTPARCRASHRAVPAAGFPGVRDCGPHAARKAASVRDSGPPDAMTNVAGPDGGRPDVAAHAGPGAGLRVSVAGADAAGESDAVKTVPVDAPARTAVGHVRHRKRGVRAALRNAPARAPGGRGVATGAASIARRPCADRVPMADVRASRDVRGSCCAPRRSRRIGAARSPASRGRPRGPAT